MAQAPHKVEPADLLRQLIQNSAVPETISADKVAAHPKAMMDNEALDEFAPNLTVQEPDEFAPNLTVQEPDEFAPNLTVQEPDEFAPSLMVPSDTPLGFPAEGPRDSFPPKVVQFGYHPAPGAVHQMRQDPMNVWSMSGSPIGPNYKYAMEWDPRRFGEGRMQMNPFLPGRPAEHVPKTSGGYTPQQSTQMKVPRKRGDEKERGVVGGAAGGARNDRGMSGGLTITAPIAKPGAGATCQQPNSGGASEGTRTLQALTRESDGQVVRWTQDSRRLKGCDKIFVSPQFELHGCGNSLFRMMMRAKQSPGRGSGSFKASGGVGSLCLKLESADERFDGAAMFVVTIGGSASTTEESVVVTHDFSDRGVCRVQNADGVDWNFLRGFESADGLVCVCLQLIPPANVQTQQVPANFPFVADKLAAAHEPVVPTMVKQYQ